MSTPCFNAILGGCNWDVVLAVLREMDSRRVEKDSLTFSTAITACERADMWDASFEILDERLVQLGDRRLRRSPLCATLLPGTNDDVDENAIESLGFAAVAESLRAGVPHLLPSESTQSGQQNPRKTSPRRLADQSHSMVEQRLPGEEHAAGHGFQSTTAHW